MDKRTAKLFLCLLALFAMPWAPGVQPTFAQEIGTKFKEGQLYYRVTSVSPPEVEVRRQNEVEPYWSSEEKPIGEVVIPASVAYGGKNFAVTGIGEKAFWECHDLTSVSIPSSVRRIGVGALAFCENLAAVTLHIENLAEVSVDSRAFYIYDVQIPKTCKFYVPESALQAYREHPAWKWFPYILPLGGNVVPVERIRIEPEGPVAIAVDEGIEFRITVEPADATCKGVVWSCDNEEVAYINDNDATGVVQGRVPGTATFTATAHNGVSASCTVEVLEMALGRKFKHNGLYYKVSQASPLGVAVVAAEGS